MHYKKGHNDPGAVFLGDINTPKMSDADGNTADVDDKQSAMKGIGGKKKRRRRDPHTKIEASTYELGGGGMLNVGGDASSGVLGGRSSRGGPPALGT